MPSKEDCLLVTLVNESANIGGFVLLTSCSVEGATEELQPCFCDSLDVLAMVACGIRGSSAHVCVLVGCRGILPANAS